MNKNFISLLCGLVCCTMAFGQMLTPFTGCPNVYVAGFKNATSCVGAPYSVYNIGLNGATSTNPIFTIPNSNVELNGIGISAKDNMGYALIFNRPSDCLSPQPTSLIRFGASGGYVMLGVITPPTQTSAVLPPLGAVDANNNYYFGAADLDGKFYVGKISNINALPANGGALTATYTQLTTLCPGIYADWAVNPKNNNQLYTYGIYNDRANGGTTSNQLVKGTLIRVDMTAGTVSCVGTPTYNPAFFTDTSDDNFAGVMFGADGFLYGMNVKDRSFYKIDTATGAITKTGAVDAGTGQLRGDLGSCASYVATIPPTPFTCPNTYLISYKEGTNCTVNPNGVYSFTNYQTGTINPTPIFSTPDTIEVNAIGISKRDGFGYGFIYRRVPIPGTATPDCTYDTLKFFRFGANGVRQILGYVLRPVNTALDLSSAVGCMNSNGTYYFTASANLQPFLCRIERTDTLTEIPNRQIPFTYNAIQVTCLRSSADWAINPTTGNLVTYGIYVNSANQVAGSMVSVDINTFVASCYGVETTGVFTNGGQDNFGGIMFGADASMYGVNVFTKKYYRINPNTGVIVEVNTVPAGTPNIRTDMASCITDAISLPLGFDKPAVTSLGECKAELSWKVSGVEDGDAFVIEKSFDGVNFTTLTTLKATTTGTNTYSVTDSKTGITNYYRIKGVSKNGDVKYSPVVRFLSSCGGKNNVTLFQNLLTNSKIVTGEVSLYKSQTVTATIYNATGVKVYGKTTNATAGVSRFSYDISSLSKGVYLLQTVIGQERFTEKFIVQ